MFNTLLLWVGMGLGMYDAMFRGTLKEPILTHEAETSMRSILCWSPPSWWLGLLLFSAPLSPLSAMFSISNHLFEHWRGIGDLAIYYLLLHASK